MKQLLVVAAIVAVLAVAFSADALTCSQRTVYGKTNSGCWASPYCQRYNGQCSNACNSTACSKSTSGCGTVSGTSTCYTKCSTITSPSSCWGAGTSSTACTYTKSTGCAIPCTKFTTAADCGGPANRNCYWVSQGNVKRCFPKYELAVDFLTCVSLSGFWDSSALKCKKSCSALGTAANCNAVSYCNWVNTTGLTNGASKCAVKCSSVSSETSCRLQASFGGGCMWTGSTCATLCSNFNKTQCSAQSACRFLNWTVAGTTYFTGCTQKCSKLSVANCGYGTYCSAVEGTCTDSCTGLAARKLTCNTKYCTPSGQMCNQKACSAYTTTDCYKAGCTIQAGSCKKRCSSLYTMSSCQANTQCSWTQTFGYSVCVPSCGMYSTQSACKNTGNCLWTKGACKTKCGSYGSNYTACTAASHCQFDSNANFKTCGYKCENFDGDATNCVSNMGCLWDGRSCSTRCEFKSGSCSGMYCQQNDDFSLCVVNEKVLAAARKLNSLGAGVIAAIAIGAVVVIAVIVFFICKKKKGGADDSHKDFQGHGQSNVQYQQAMGPSV